MRLCNQASMVSKLFSGYNSFIFDRGGIIMQDTKLVVTVTLYFASKNYFHFN